MQTHMDTETEDSDAKEAAAPLPAKLGAPSKSEGPDEEFETPTGKDDDTQSRLPHLRDYNIHVSWALYVGMFLVAIVHQGLCNYLTASGIANKDNVAMAASVKILSSSGGIIPVFWASLVVVGERWRSRLVIIFSLLASINYGVLFTILPAASPFAVLPILYTAMAIGMIWSRRRCFSIGFVTIMSILHAGLLYVVQSLQAVQSRLPEAAQQFVVPALKTFYLGIVSEVCTMWWKKMHSKPCSPHALTYVLLIALVTAETMGLVGLLAAVDSDNIWSNAAIFCAATVVMETSSRSGILLSFMFKVMGKRYRFTDAGHIFRWAKMWASYCWVSIFIAFVVPALILGLKVENSNFTFLRWEPWVLVGIYMLLQMATDFMYVYIQHYIRPSLTLSETAARCLVLGEATPLFGENEHIGDGSGMQSPENPKEEEFESAAIKVGPWTITAEAVLMFALLDGMSIWNHYVRGQFCVYGTFLPSEDGSCD